MDHPGAGQQRGTPSLHGTSRGKDPLPPRTPIICILILETPLLCYLVMMTLFLLL